MPAKLGAHITCHLIDTNIIAEVRKGARCDGNVAAWYDGVADGDL